MTNSGYSGRVHAAVEAGDVGGLRIAIARAADPRRAVMGQDETGDSPVEIAIERGHVGMLSVLAEAGADFHAGVLDGDTALYQAARSADPKTIAEVLRIEPAERWSHAERTDAVSVLADLNRADLLDLVPPPDLSRLIPIADRAAMLGHARSLEWCLSHGVASTLDDPIGDDKTTLLHSAAGGAQPATVALLLDAGAAVDSADSDGRTPLMFAARREPRRVESRVSDTAKFAIDREEGRVIYAAAPPDPPPLGRADTALALLLEAGARASATDRSGLDALAILKESYGKAFGASQPTRRVELATVAATASSMVPVDLAEAFWREDSLEKDEKRIRRELWAAEEEALACVVGAFRCALEAAGAVGRSEANEAVIAALKAQDAESLRVALDAGGSVSVAITTRNGNGWTTPLGWAVSRGDVACCNVLLDADAHPDDGGQDGPPLIDAARAGRVEIVELLLKRGADGSLSQSGEMPYTALDAARIARKRDCVAALKRAGVAEPPRDEPFTPGADLLGTSTELLVRGDASVVADSVARAIGGEIERDVLGREIQAAPTRGYIVVQLAGSAWSSVVPHVGCDRVADVAWSDVASDVSSRSGRLAYLLSYEKVSGQHAYELYEGGEMIERFAEEIGEEEFGPTGLWESKRGRSRPEKMGHGHAVLNKLAIAERFCFFGANPGGRPGEPFEMAFPSDRRSLADVIYVKA
ncbi:MAG: ankyrin repeat domain-containing protein [Planctomycetota bacterium]